MFSDNHLWNLFSPTLVESPPPLPLPPVSISVLTSYPVYLSAVSTSEIQPVHGSGANTEVHWAMAFKGRKNLHFSTVIWEGILRIKMSFWKWGRPPIIPGQINSPQWVWLVLVAVSWCSSSLSLKQAAKANRPAAGHPPLLTRQGISKSCLLTWPRETVIGA